MSSINILATSSASPLNQLTSNPTAAAKNTSNGQFTKEELELIARLKRRDREVRAHEQAHRSAAGQYASGAPQYTYQKGPDGKNYAIGGEVSIDTSPVPGDPEATLRKAQQIRRAANAPVSPSSTDRAVAAQAAALAVQAQIELSRQEKNSESLPDNQNNSVNNDLLSNTYGDKNTASRLIDELI